jgi:tungstate transport system permease protein
LDEFGSAFGLAFDMVLQLDPVFTDIVLRSLFVSGAAVSIAALIGFPFGALLAFRNFPGRFVIVAALNSLMGLPPVVVGLVVYLLLSRSGPFGILGLLYTPTAMIIAQTILIFPIIAALAYQTLSDLDRHYAELFRSLCASPIQHMLALIWEGRASLLTAFIAGFGRAIAEVGAVMIVGGNINHVTRVMTTTIALETSKGNLALALGLGVVLLSLALITNLTLLLLRHYGAPQHA